VTDALVSLASVSARKWTQTDEIREAVEKGEIKEIANIQAVFTHYSLPCVDPSSKVA
jgi:hypothetical protein